MDPISHFPYEIFSEIIRFAAYGVPSGPLPFLMTSNGWLTTILDSPEVWTCIKVDNRPDTYHRTSVFQHLSRDRPIELHILSWALRSTETLKPVLKESSRIRVIRIKQTDFQGNGPMLYKSDASQPRPHCWTKK